MQKTLNRTLVIKIYTILSVRENFLALATNVASHRHCARTLFIRRSRTSKCNSNWKSEHDPRFYHLKKTVLHLLWIQLTRNPMIAIKHIFSQFLLVANCFITVKHLQCIKCICIYIMSGVVAKNRFTSFLAHKLPVTGHTAMILLWIHIFL